MNLPKLDFYINDFSGILRDDFKVKYNNLFSEHQKISWEQIATVFIEHRNWNELIDIAMKLFNENGIWEKETNNWLLLIISTQEKKIRILTGKWMEIEFSDEYCKEIIENELRGLLNNWEYEKLIQAWYEISTNKRKPQSITTSNLWNVSEYEQKKYSNDMPQNTNTKVSKIIWTFVFIVTFLIFLLVFLTIANLGWCNYTTNYWDSSYDWWSSYWSDSSSNSSSDWWSSSSDWGGGSSNAWWYWD